MKKEKNYSLTYPKIVAVGFAVLILLGSALLMLPISSAAGGVAYNDALFTAASAACITGLVPFDTFSNWSFFGQVVILCLIQTGGLGFITVLTVVSRMIKKKISLKQKMLLKDSIGSFNLGEVDNLVKEVLIFTAACEGTGALLLMTRFIPLAGLGRGIWMSVFTSISAYCNAGFDLMGMFEKSSSLTTVNNDPIIIITISFLVIFGGLGFIVWDDIKNNKFKFKAFDVHTKLVLITTATLLIAGTVLFFAFEYSNTFENMSPCRKILNAFFCSVTPRTAGFNSVDTAAIMPQSKMLTIILMLIGGSSGSTAGGVKTTTIAILFLCLIASTKNKDEIEVFNRRISPDAVKRAVSIVLINISEIFIAVIAISLLQNELGLTDVIFECTSAIGTVGMSTGITSKLELMPQLIIIMLMYIGRLTSLIFALSFVRARPKTTAQKPTVNILIG